MNMESRIRKLREKWDSRGWEKSETAEGERKVESGAAESERRVESERIRVVA